MTNLVCFVVWPKIKLSLILTSSKMETKSIFGLKSLVITVVMVFALSFSTGQIPDFYCNDEFCNDTYLATPCPAPKKCANQGSRKYLSANRCNCCPGTFCFNYLEEDAICAIEQQTDFTLCGPFQTCVANDTQQNPKCENMDNTSCTAERKKYRESYEKGTAGTAQFQPECTAKGEFAIRQCLPGSACFCSNRTGERIFGLSLPSEINNCHCSKDIDTLRNLNFTGHYPRCIGNGDYDMLQCVGRTCFCFLDPKNQKPLAEIKNLTCYEPNKLDKVEVNPSTHLRLCEYKRASFESDDVIARGNGTVVLQADRPVCDIDGNYAPVQNRNNKYVCVDPQGVQIENFEAERNTRKPDCFCARIRWMMRDIVNGQPDCCKRGSFRAWQCSGPICYCVDPDGKQRSDVRPIEVPFEKLDELPCYGQGDECVERS